MPAGTVVRINGTGFSKDTSVEVNQVSISSTQYIGPQEIDVTLSAPTELTGKKFILPNPNGSTLEHFSYLAGAGYLFPPIALSGQYMLGFGAHLQGFGMENPNLTPVDILEQFSNQLDPPGTITSEQSFTLAGNSSSINGAGNFTTVGLIASGPISVLQLHGTFGIGILGDGVNFVFPDAARTVRAVPRSSSDAAVRKFFSGILSSASPASASRAHWHHAGPPPDWTTK